MSTASHVVATKSLRSSNDAGGAHAGELKAPKPSLRATPYTKAHNPRILELTPAIVRHEGRGDRVDLGQARKAAVSTGMIDGIDLAYARIDPPD